MGRERLDTRPGRSVTAKEPRSNRWPAKERGTQSQAKALLRNERRKDERKREWATGATTGGADTPG